jgi:hypothetical protein
MRRERLRLETGEPAYVTIHPSAVLRAGDDREERRAELLSDLRLVRRAFAALSVRKTGTR